jgi:hypothetical protein
VVQINHIFSTVVAAASFEVAALVTQDRCPLRSGPTYSVTDTKNVPNGNLHGLPRHYELIEHFILYAVHKTVAASERKQTKERRIMIGELPL